MDFDAAGGTSADCDRMLCGAVARAAAAFAAAAIRSPSGETMKRPIIFGFTVSASSFERNSSRTMLSMSVATYSCMSSAAGFA